MSEYIVERYVEISLSITSLCDKCPQHHDYCFKNQILRSRDELLYVDILYDDICYAMNAGNIGCVKTLIAPWVHMFKATGKHKDAICLVLSRI